MSSSLAHAQTHTRRTVFVTCVCLRRAVARRLKGGSGKTVTRRRTWERLRRGVCAAAGRAEGGSGRPTRRGAPSKAKTTLVRTHVGQGEGRRRKEEEMLRSAPHSGAFLGRRERGRRFPTDDGDDQPVANYCRIARASLRAQTSNRKTTPLPTKSSSRP